MKIAEGMSKINVRTGREKGGKIRKDKAPPPATKKRHKANMSCGHRCVVWPSSTVRPKKTHTHKHFSKICELISPNYTYTP